MKKRLIPVLLLIAALLLTNIAPAETTVTKTLCPGCGEEETHRACETCGAYVCENDYFTEKHGALCIGCGERFCGPYRQKGHTACPCGELSCTEDFEPSEHIRCSCGVYACKDPLFEINHKACDGCGVQLCDKAYGRHSHKLCSGCGMRKCDPEYNADEHDKCNGCRELLCVSENDHTSCPRCNRYVCKAMDNYHEFDHSLNSWGWPMCLEYIEEPEPLLPPAQEEENTSVCPGGCGASIKHEKCKQFGESSCGLYTCQIVYCSYLVPNGKKCGMHHERTCTSSTTSVAYCQFCNMCLDNPASSNTHASPCAECGRCNFSHSDTCSKK